MVTSIYNFDFHEDARSVNIFFPSWLHKAGFALILVLGNQAEVRVKAEPSEFIVEP